MSFFSIAFLSSCLILQSSYAQPTIENWNTFVDPEKRFTLFYPPNLQAKEKENFLSSTDLILTSNSSREFKISISYVANDSSLNYTANEEIVPYNDLRNLEQQIKPAFRIYNIVQNSSEPYSLYGFPTAGNVIDYTKHTGESGRTLNVLGVVKGKNTFLFSYSNSIERFYRYLPTINQIISSIVILK